MFEVKTIQEARKEYKQLIDEGRKKTSTFRKYFLKKFAKNFSLIMSL